MILRHARKLRSLDFKNLQISPQPDGEGDLKNKPNWEKITAVATISGVVVTFIVGAVAAGIYYYQANIAEKGLIEPYRVPSYIALMQKLHSICSDFQRVYPGAVIESSEHGTILIEETLSSMPLEQFKTFQSRIQAKTGPLMADAEIHARLSKNEKDIEIFKGLAGELERYSFERIGMPDRYKDGQLWITAFTRDCRNTYYDLLNRLGGDTPVREGNWSMPRVLSLKELTELGFSSSHPFIEGVSSKSHPAFPADLVRPIE